MLLRYGVNENNALVGIEEVSSGKTGLSCPYCEDKLIAKKGKIKEHHFAHQGQTCLTVTRGKIPNLPLYDNFNIQLSVKELDELKVFWNNYGISNYDICVKPSWRLVSSKLLAFNEERGGFYEFTSLGKIPVGALSLTLFNEVQEPLLCEKLVQLEQKAERAQLASLSTLPERLADLQIYRALFKRVLTNTLYFLEILVDGKTFHKIGVTCREIEQRVKEVQRDMKLHFNTVAIEVLGTWEHRGNVELYFKHRYKDFNYKIGTLTEYFKFDNVNSVLLDLRQMKPKVLNQSEVDILEEKPAPVITNRSPH
ncbi:MAG TPA: competence protein CoiA family protein [Coleofasciculaceae cyanobacterium]|jgi:hypothetical protein